MATATLVEKNGYWFVKINGHRRIPNGDYALADCGNDGVNCWGRILLGTNTDTGAPIYATVTLGTPPCDCAGGLIASGPKNTVETSVKFDISMLRPETVSFSANNTSSNVRTKMMEQVNFITSNQNLIETATTFDMDTNSIRGVLELNSLDNYVDNIVDNLDEIFARNTNQSVTSPRNGTSSFRTPVMPSITMDTATFVTDTVTTTNEVYEQKRIETSVGKMNKFSSTNTVNLPVIMIPEPIRKITIIKQPVVQPVIQTQELQQQVIRPRKLSKFTNPFSI